MNNEIAHKEQNAVSTIVHRGETLILKSDLMVPYLSQGQGLSEAVQEKKVQLGDIYRSTTGEILGNPEKPVDVILLAPLKQEWVIQKRGKSRFEFHHVEPRNAANETWPWTFWANEDGEIMEQGQKGALEWKRVKRLSTFGLLPHDIEAFKLEMKKVEAGELPDPNKALMPVALSFLVTSYKAGKVLANMVTKCATFKVPMWKYVVSLGNAAETNDEGTFYVWKTDGQTKAVDKDHLPFVEDWISQLGSGVALNVHEDADGATDMGTQGPREVNPNAKNVC